MKRLLLRRNIWTSVELLKVTQEGIGKKKVKETDSFKSPISKTWLALIAFLLIGGGLLELFVGFL